MAENVKFIFKTLIKVPCIIMVSFFVFNAFAFGLTYFKLLGLSYVVMQTAVENNYIPATELDTLNNYLANISNTGVIDNARIVLSDPNNSSIKDATQKRQYGQPVTVGITAHYRFIWPLTPKDQLANTSDQFIGYGQKESSNFSGFADDGTLEERRMEIENNQNNNITLIYTVPGLKYYPDLN